MCSTLHCTQYLPAAPPVDLHRLARQVTTVTLSVAVLRVSLGYWRMNVRYKSIVDELLRERTIASQEGALECVGSFWVSGP